MAINILEQARALWRWRSGRSCVIGIDIGSATLKMMGLRMGRKPSVVFSAAAELPAGCGPEYIVGAIQRMLKENAVTGGPAVLAFTDESVIYRRIELPHMASDEIVGALKWQVKDSVTFDVEKSVSEFEVLREFQKEDGSKAMDIVAAIAPREALERRLQIMKKAGLSVASAGLSPFGLARIMRLQDGMDEKAAVMAVDLGHSKTEVAIFKGRNLDFVRVVPVGYGALITAMAQSVAFSGVARGLSKEEAEETIHRFGIPYDEFTLQNGITSVQVVSLIRPVIERLSKEIRRTIDYYVQEYGAQDVSALYLVGAAARLKNLDRYLNEELKIPVKKIDTLSSIDLSGLSAPQKEAFSFALPLLGVTLGYGKRSDLLPYEYRVERIEFIEKVSLRTVFAVTAVILLTSFFFLKFIINNYSYRLKNVQFQRSVLGEVKVLKEDLAMWQGFLVQARGTDVPVEPVMKALSALSPPRLVLCSLSIDNRSKTLEMQGTVYEARGAAEGVLTRFMEELEKSKYFKEAQLGYVQERVADREQVSDFGISCQLE